MGGNLVSCVLPLPLIGESRGKSGDAPTTESHISTSLSDTKVIWVFERGKRKKHDDGYSVHDDTKSGAPCIFLLG